MLVTPPLAAKLRPAVLDRAAGYRTLDALQDPATQSALTDVEALAPGFADWIVTALFGGTYQRTPELAARDRQLLNLAALTALGGTEPQLAGHVRTSLRIGMTGAEVVECFVHLAPYLGVPRALAGLRVAAGVLAEHPENTPDTGRTP
ncbi:carboxymuconolactone decarboxylase family protein [Streptomyces sp. NPDC047046]|uniref:carboxymuconolactone decarboxylase family protein n=1 Tax=Streptomyces sp. NPDC047046 TaxID=3155378 RepID=UPI0033F15B32